MTFGIVVDDTVHFLMSYLRLRKSLGFSPQKSIMLTMKSVGHALILTSLVIAVGFAIMATSGFQINEHVGWLTVYVVAFAVLTDLLLLPPLILLLEGKEK